VNVKSSIKILSVIILIAFYSYSIGVMNTSIKITENYGNPKSDKEFYFSNISTNLFCYTFQKESSVSNFNNLSTSNLKHLFNNPWLIIKAAKQIFDSEFFQYTNISVNLLIQFRKTVIIFPFNYFW
jgi:hypothetical protein